MGALSVERCNAREHADEIKQLFARNGRPEFETIFERTYPEPASNGGWSWVGRDQAGNMVMHLALFPRTFSDGNRTMSGALLGDLIADESHRDFWGPLKLLRRAVGDSRGELRLDMLYTDPSPNSVAVAKAAGFTTLGELRRYVIPTARAYIELQRIRTGASRLKIARLGSLSDPLATQMMDDAGGTRHFRARRSAEFCEARAGVAASRAQAYVALTRDGSPAALGILAPHEGTSTTNLVDLVWNDSRASTASSMLAIADAARAEGKRKLCCLTLEKSRFATTLRDCGFLERESTQAVFALPLRAGVELPPGQDWLLTTLDGSGW